MDGWLGEWLGGWLSGSQSLRCSWHVLEIDCYCAVRNLNVEVLEKEICELFMGSLDVTGY